MSSMTYFSYHAKAKMLIKSGELVDWKMVEEYNGISPALVLFFKSHRPMPVREHRWDEYFSLIEKYFGDKN